MKNFFKKIKSYSFWVALASASVVLVNTLGKVCGFSIPNKVVEDVILGVAGVLAVFGIVNMGDKKASNTPEDQSAQQQQQDENDSQNEEEKPEDEDKNSEVKDE